jgi:hypothetical protein
VSKEEVYPRFEAIASLWLQLQNHRWDLMGQDASMQVLRRFLRSYSTTLAKHDIPTASVESEVHILPSTPRTDQRREDTDVRVEEEAELNEEVMKTEDKKEEEEEKQQEEKEQPQELPQEPSTKLLTI